MEYLKYCVEGIIKNAKHGEAVSDMIVDLRDSKYEINNAYVEGVIDGDEQEDLLCEITEVQEALEVLQKYYRSNVSFYAELTQETE